MKRFLSGIATGCVFLAAVSALPDGRTVINAENVPVVYAFVPNEELPLIVSRGSEPPPPQSAIALLQERGDELNLLAPGGMWRIPTDPGVIVGYYTGGASALTDRLVSIAVPTGREPVRIVPYIDPAGGSATLVETWDVPDYPEPVLLDGMNDEWSEIADVARFGSMSEPPRIEDSVRGEEIEPQAARFYRVAGTGVRRVRSVLGTRWWFVAIDAGASIESGTYYHLRVFPRRDTASSAGQVVVPIDAVSGPVVFRDPTGRVSLVGQYVRRRSFVEFSIARGTIESMMPQAFDREWSIDIAASRGDDSVREHYTYGTVFLNEIPTE